jgi:hypothetical protein
MTIICDNCEKKVDVAGHFTFNETLTIEIWKGHLCLNCQIDLVNGKGLHKFQKVDEN